MTDTFDLGVDDLINIPPPHETAFKVAVNARRQGTQRLLLALAERDIYAETIVATRITP